MKKNVLRIAILLCFILLPFQVVDAKSSIKATVNSSISELKSGEEVIITLRMNEFTDIEKGINAYKATLDYDTNIFEEINQSSFVAINNWEFLQYNKDTKEFVAIHRVGVTSPTDVVQIKLKVKDNIPATQTNIWLKDIVASEGKEDLFIPEEKVTLNIIKVQTPEHNPGNNSGNNQGNNLGNNSGNNSGNSNVIIPGSSNNPSSPNIKDPNDPSIDNSGSNPNNGNSNSNNPNIKDDNSNIIKDDDKEEEDNITKTKKYYLWLIIIAIIEAIILMYYILIKRKKEKEEEEYKKYLMYIVVGLVSALLIGEVFAAGFNYAMMGELNGDSKIDYNDAVLLEKHLIHLQKLPDDKLEYADMNGDQKLTVTDLTLLVQKLEQTLDYKVILDDADLEKYYYDKNSEVFLKFFANISYGANLKTVIINNQEYPVQKVNETTNEYYVTLNVGNTAGIKEFVFKQATLDNDKEVKLDYTIKVDVLKDLPTIENYKVEEDIDNEKLYLSLDLIDNDNSLTTALLIISKEDGEKIQEIKLQKGNNSRLEVQVSDGEKYKANIILNYSLASNQLEHEGDYPSYTEWEKELQLKIDYQFQISNIKTYRNNTETNTFEKEEPITIGFESTNATSHIPSSVKINGKTYTSIQKQDNRYETLIEGITEIGETEFKIEEIILDNGKSFNIEENNTIKVDIIKRTPSISDFTSKENTETNSLQIDFDIQDQDKTIEEIKMILFDQNNKEISNQVITSEELLDLEHITKDLQTSITSQYKVKIVAKYSQKDGEESKEIVLLEQEIKATPRLEITNITKDKAYYEKGENAVFTYTINTNKSENIKTIRINNEDCIATKVGDNTYQITLTAPNTSGIKELNTTKMIYSDGSEVNLSKTTELEVLKDKPTLENFVQHDHIEDSSITLNFDIIDNDNSFVRGEAILTKRTEDQVETIQREIKAGQNEINFPVENAQNYTLEIKVVYDRDTNSEHADNQNSEILKTTTIALIADYQLQINNIKTQNANGETSYFAKKEGIIITFESTNISSFEPEQAMINGKMYNLTKGNNRYQATIDGYEESGVKDLIIEKIILSNTIEIESPENSKIAVEIRKDAPTITNFTYAENTDGTISVKFTAEEKEETITSGEIVIEDDQNNIIKRIELAKKENEFTFTPNGSETFRIRVYANYDLDTNQLGTGANEYKNAVLLDEIINVGKRLVEMKDINEVTLYKNVNNNVTKITSIREEDLKDLSPYIVKVEMDELDSFYAPISSYRIENNQMIFTLEYDNIVQYNGDQKKNNLEVVYGVIENGVSANQSLEELIAAIRANPSGTFSLYKDYDFTGIKILDNSVPFTGTLNGNGHTITNLSNPLFYTIQGGTIENLVIMNSSMTANGALAKTIIGSTVRNVYLKNITINAPDEAGTGSLAGVVQDNSLIENCSATNVNVGNRKRTGGFIGQAYGSTIRNCYLQGYVSSTSDASGGFVGGVPGGAAVLTIENVYVHVTTNFIAGTNAGICGWSRNLTLKNSISIANNTQTGYPYSVYGSLLNSNSSLNIYELSTTNMISQATHAKINKVTVEELRKKEFYTNTLHWSEDIWDFSEVSEKYPTLKSDPILSKPKEEKPNNTSIYLPDYSRISKIVNYDENREIAYYNMYKLMPFYDAKYYIEDGNKIATDHVLNTKLIKQVFAYDKDGKWIGALALNNKDTIKSIRILFNDNESIDYNVTYKEDTGKIVHYKIDELGIEYNYDKYLVNTDSSIYKYIVNKIKEYNYVDDIATLTPETEVRNYTENYVHVQNNAEKFALYLLANSNEYNATIINSNLEALVMSELTNNRNLERLIYTYNYFDRFYNFEIGGINMTDIVFFDGSVFSKNLNPTTMSTNLISRANETNRKTENLTAFYNNYIKPSTGKTLADFLEYFMKNLTNEKYKNDPGSWILDNWDGGVAYEQAADRYPEVRYRIWDHFKARQELILPVLSYHGGDMYVLGVPSCILVGNLDDSYYFNKNYKDVTLAEKLTLLKNFAIPASNFYDTLAGILNPTGFNKLKSTTMISYDNSGSKNWSNIENVPPVYKALHEVMNKYIPANSSSAYANGTDIFWHYDALKFYAIYTHEAIHNQDGHTILEGTGRRKNVNAEQFTDGFLTQSFSEYTIYPNYTYNFGIDTAYTTNLTIERINTREKIDDYYKKMYEVFGVLDYLQAQAFLELTPAEQSALASIVVQDGANSSFTKKTAEEFKAMNLQTIEDLWDNQIVVVNSNSTGPVGAADWYLVHNDIWTVNKAEFIQVAYQMLGTHGYTGYVGYAGNRFGGTDLAAIRGITGNPEMTWKKYQMDRYKEIADNLSKITYFDVAELKNELKNAMQIDASLALTGIVNNNTVLLRKNIYTYLKRTTNDFRSGIYDELPNVITVSSANEFIEKITENFNRNIKLAKDLDFSGITSEKETILTNFIGTIDGNGHKIIGLSKPLFASISYSTIKNIKFENATITTNVNNSGLLAKDIKYSTLQDITLNNINITGISKLGGLSGTITYSIIENIVYNVNVTSLNSSTDVGGLFGAATYSTITNVHGKESTVSGNNNVGGLIGNANYIYYLSESSFNGNVTGRGTGVGGLVGTLYNSKVENSYTLGSVTGNARVGGFVGYVDSSKINKNFSNVNVKGSNTASTGGFNGAVLNANSTRMFSTYISNNISLGGVSNGYKLDSSSKAIIEAFYSNNYELVESIGHMSSEREDVDLTGRIKSINLANLNSDFYTNTLGFNSEIWDLSNVTSGGLPKLKNLDSNNVGVIIKKTEIDSIEDFIKINEHSDAIFSITKDLDFSNYQSENTSVITAIFTGRLEGNGHTISNLTNASLFENFRGTVQDLNIQNFNYDASSENFVAAFTKQSFQATFKNMKFSSITLNGNNNVAVVSGMDGREGANSVFDRISVKDANVTGAGVYISTFIGRKFGGKITNVYVEGTLNVTGTENGGIVGASQEGVQISNVISNVSITKTRNTYTGTGHYYNAGLVGNIYNTPTIKNSIALGNMSGYTASNVLYIPFKFTGAEESQVLAGIQNCYEYQDALGSTRITTNTDGRLNEATSNDIHNKSFYVDQLHFDSTIWNLDSVEQKGYPELR